MHFGFILPNLLSPISHATAIKTSARLAEDAGFDTLWTTDHVLMPAQYERYGKGTEMLATTAYVAGITRHVGLGLSVLILAMRNPLVAAKQIASIMHLAGDRQFIVGIGVGWNREEYNFMNADFSRRGKLTDEYIEIMQTLWTQDDPRHSGTHTFEDVLFAPRPANPPHIWIGGESEAAMQRAARTGAGYHPNIPKRVEDYAAMVKRVRELSDGRPITMSARLTIDLREDVAQAVDYLQALQDVGLEYPVVNLKHETLGELLRQIEVFGNRVIPALG